MQRPGRSKSRSLRTHREVLGDNRRFLSSLSVTNRSLCSDSPCFRRAISWSKSPLHSTSKMRRRVARISSTIGSFIVCSWQRCQQFFRCHNNRRVPVKLVVQKRQSSYYLAIGNMGAIPGHEIIHIIRHGVGKMRYVGRRRSSKPEPACICLDKELYVVESTPKSATIFVRRLTYDRFPLRISSSTASETKSSKRSAAVVHHLRVIR